MDEKQIVIAFLDLQQRAETVHAKIKVCPDHHDWIEISYRSISHQESIMQPVSSMREADLVIGTIQAILENV